MKALLTFFLFAFCFTNTNAQFFKKIKQKAEQAVNKAIDKKSDNEPAAKEETAAADNNGAAPKPSDTEKKDVKVYSKFDFVPGSSILYFDNFEKDNIGEAPLGWLTTTSAETVTIDGLEGKWLQLGSTSSKHLVRSKKQGWGNNFTVEFDLLIVKDSYDPRIDFALINTGGNLVTDEHNLQSGKNVLYVSTILGDGGKQSRVSLYNTDNINKAISDRMSENLTYGSSAPVHVSMCVQGKRFRFWWNEKKIFDLQAVNEDFLPNQFGFNFGSVGGCNYYVSNFRIAKDVPDTRAQFEEGKLISNLLFYSGKAELKPESMGALLDVSKVLKDATAPVKIVGHTDADGDDAANMKLSQQRADAVKQILVSQYNIDESKLTTEGRGETQPIADNNNAEGKAQNRRVEFIFKPEADKYVKPAGVSNIKSTIPASKPAAAKNSSGSDNAAASVTLKSKILTVSLPYAQIMKTGESTYTFIASKEEGNSKENYLKIKLQSVNISLKPETFNFKEINEKNTMYGTKKFAEITGTEAVLYYGAGQKPYIYRFSPIIANGAMASYVDETLQRKLPAVSAATKFVIEKVENGKASGYFVVGNMIEGLKPVKKGDAMQETFTTGFADEMKCTFSNVPVY